MEMYPQSLVAIFLFIVGSAAGSFINVLSDRLPNDETILGRSHCEYCKHTLSWLDLFPIISYLFLRGRCRYCRKELSFYYPLVEIATGTIFVLTWFFLPTELNSGVSQIIQIGAYEVSKVTLLRVVALGIVGCLSVVLWADMKFQIIPDSMQVCLVILALTYRGLMQSPTLNNILYILFEGLVIMSLLLILYILTKGKGMGFGDVKLAFIIGLLLGIKGGLIALYISFIFGALLGLILILRRAKSLKSKIAFGPFLIGGIVGVLFFKKEIFDIIRLYWGV
jgi:leader peptidase (prepilin peptidase) / N-methyltransferase